MAQVLTKSSLEQLTKLPLPWQTSTPASLVALERFPTGRAWLEISRQNLRHNAQLLQALLPAGCRLMPVLKADAYGHGALAVAQEMQQLGYRAFCVASAKEGVELRQAGIEGEILVLGYTHPELAPLLWGYQLSQTVVDFDYGLALAQFGQPLKVHLKIDTGMHRLGLCADQLPQICELLRCQNLQVEGMFSHFCVSESLEAAQNAYTLQQIESFRGLVEQLSQAGHSIPKLHLQSSYGIFTYPQLHCDYARAGIALYGMLSTEADTLQWGGQLRPVLSLKARVALTRSLQPGESAGYGLSFTAAEQMRVAVLSIGYADGLPRSLSHGRGSVLLHGRHAPILGPVCMDQTLVDVSHIPEAAQHDIAVLIGQDQGAEISACQLATASDTITNEILSRLGRRLEHVLL